VERESSPREHKGFFQIIASSATVLCSTGTILRRKGNGWSSEAVDWKLSVECRRFEERGKRPVCPRFSVPGFPGFPSRSCSTGMTVEDWLVREIPGQDRFGNRESFGRIGRFLCKRRDISGPGRRRNKPECRNYQIEGCPTEENRGQTAGPIGVGQSHKKVAGNRPNQKVQYEEETTHKCGQFSAGQDPHDDANNRSDRFEEE